MNISGRQYHVNTTHCTLAVEEWGREEALPLLFIHGNSSSGQVFRNQIQEELVEKYRLIIPDLPGHGQSDNAIDPIKTYTRPGLADVLLELLEKINVKAAVIVGWSLGGHIAIEMMPKFTGLKGLMIIGAPPVGANGMAQGFKSAPHSAFAGKEELSNDEINIFLEAIFNGSAEPFLYETMARTDGRFRKRLFEAARAGEGVDQRLTIENSSVPVAVVNGEQDKIANLDYFDTVTYRNLWTNKCYRLSDAGHTPFWEAPVIFNDLLDRFLQDLN